MPYYSNAPIAEAVIDLNVSFDEAPPTERIEEFAQLLKGDFPQMQRINTLKMAVTHNGEDDEPSTNASRTPLGVRMTNAKGDRVLQIRRQGLSLSHLQPYSEWSTFAGEMKQLWDRYATEFKPTSVTRLAVRYINRIRVPQGCDLDVYLNITPRLLEEVCPNVEGYFMQLVLPQLDLGEEWKAIINTGLEPEHSSEFLSVLLDVDLFCTKTVPVDDAAVWDVLNVLRDRKNKIFEAAITDEVRRMIE